jgi:hypothetical protein
LTQIQRPALWSAGGNRPVDDDSADRRYAESPVVMPFRHPAFLASFTLEIEFDQNCGLTSDHPSVMLGLDRYNLRRHKFQLAAVAVFDMDLPTSEEPYMRVHAVVRADYRLDMR